MPSHSRGWLPEPTVGVLVDWLAGSGVRDFGALTVETRGIENRAIGIQGPELWQGETGL